MHTAILPSILYHEHLRAHLISIDGSGETDPLFLSATEVDTTLTDLLEKNTVLEQAKAEMEYELKGFKNYGGASASNKTTWSIIALGKNNTKLTFRGLPLRRSNKISQIGYFSIQYSFICH